MIAVVNSGTANLASVEAALQRVGYNDFIITDDADCIAHASKVILPGVGSAQAAMESLQRKKLIDTLRNLKQPLLGICLGMQLLFETSEEGAIAGQTTPCLGIIPGKIARLQSNPEVSIPHMGWNNVSLKAADSPLFRNIPDLSYFYFVHSFAAPLSQTTVASCDYGQQFTAVCNFKNYYGCQFHPERSGRAGRQLLMNFVSI